VRKGPHIDYTVYSSGYQPGAGECWDFRSIRRARNKARAFGAGSQIVRNFNQENRGEAHDWWQAEFCWVYDGVNFLKTLSLEEKKWKVDDSRWKSAPVVRAIRRRG
jgi:hypothetical protein